MLLSASKNSSRGFLAAEAAAAVAADVSDLAAVNSALPKILDKNMIVIRLLQNSSITNKMQKNLKAMLQHLYFGFQKYPENPKQVVDHMGSHIWLKNIKNG